MSSDSFFGAKSGGFGGKASDIMLLLWSPMYKDMHSISVLGVDLQEVEKDLVIPAPASDAANALWTADKDAFESSIAAFEGQAISLLDEASGVTVHAKTLLQTYSKVDYYKHYYKHIVSRAIR